MTDNLKDIELKEALDRIDWKCYIEHGTVRIKIRDGKKQMVFIERSYPD